MLAADPVLLRNDDVLYGIEGLSVINRSDDNRKLHALYHQMYTQIQYQVLTVLYAALADYICSNTL